MAKRKAKMNITGSLLGTGAAIAGGVVGKVINKPLANMNPKLRGGLKVLAGVALDVLVPNNMVKKVGNGLYVVGGIELIGSMVPALAGIGDDYNNSLGAIGEYDGDESGWITDDEYSEDIEGIGNDDPNESLGGIGDDGDIL